MTFLNLEIDNLKILVPVIFLLMWSSGAIFVKLGLEDSSVWSFLAFRSVLSFVILFLIILLFFKDELKKSLKLEKNFLLEILLVGLLIQVLYQVFYYLAIFYHLSPGLLSIFLGLQPLLTAFILREVDSLYKWLILGLGFFGLITAVSGARDVSNITIGGVTFSLLAMICISLGSIYQNRSKSNLLISALFHSMLSSVVFVCLLPFVDNYLILSTKFIVSVLWMTVVVSICATLLLFYLLKKDSADKVSILFFLVPITTIFFDYLAFDSQITWVTGVSTIIVILSIYLFNKAKKTNNYL